MNWFMFISYLLITGASLSLVFSGQLFAHGPLWGAVGTVGIILCAVSAGLWFSNIVRGE